MKNGLFKRTIIVLFLLLIHMQALALPTYEETKGAYQKSDGVLLDRHGEMIDALRVDPKGRRLEWVALKDVSPALIRNVLYCEDRNFYAHHGVSWRSIGSALFGNMLSGKSRGASTITMQLVSKLNEEIRPQRSRRSVRQKWDQIRFAREMERSWKKDEILEAYLNLVVFRGELQGIAAAARGMFHKEPSGLNTAEAAIMASLIRSPNATAGEIANRACILAGSDKGNPGGRAACREIQAAAVNGLAGMNTVAPAVSLAPHTARMLLDGRRREARSSLDGRLQRYALESLQQQLIALRDRNVSDGAVLVADNRTGEILAYVANGGPFSSAPHVDGIRARRQAGSTLKPFIYEYAIEKKIITAATILDDSPLFIATPAGIYEPHNYDNEFKGPVSVRTALASSLNIPAVRALTMIGGDEVVSRLGSLGFTDMRDAAHYGMSLALGSPDVSLLELVNAYRTLADTGRWSPLRMMPGGGEAVRKQVMTREAAFIISDILADREARSLTFDFENPLSTRFWTAVKTGTSKDMRDNWCIGYSDRYTVGVWIGNFSGSSMHHVSGISGAAPVWLDVMHYLHRGSPGKAPTCPAGIVEVCSGTVQNRKKELFIAGTEPVSAEPQVPSSDPPRILYPLSGTVIAFDPDIPHENFRIFFEANRAVPGGAWRLNEDPLSGSGKIVPWQPSRGHYSLTLVDEKRRILDAVTYEVR